MKEKNLFIIGDVHGCYFTFKKIISHWNPETEFLIQVGDLIDRGNFSRQVIQLCRELENRYPNQTCFLMGNHEWMALSYFFSKDEFSWLKKFGRKILWDYELNELKIEDDINWLKKLKTSWENNAVFISHAGITNSLFALDPVSNQGLIWNKMPLKKLLKVQVHGHKPILGQEPIFTIDSNSWNIDTGACYKNGMTALRLDNSGNKIDFLFLRTEEIDIK